MRFGAVLPFGDARDVARYAARAEESGWDAVFVAEGVWGVDAWISLAAAALATERVRLGTLLTPVPRVIPWDLASRVGTVDRLSGGRTILGAGLGALHEGWLAFEGDEGSADPRGAS
jgi:alkanesulfonate monooxygenase SsuD/methylene tetrahydromethanopterin reductase-like flavin-dependent oxidoreductase (luciferase family)